MSDPLWASLVLFVVALVGGCVPLFLRGTARALHLLIALATGVFLGVVFLWLLPEVGHVDVPGEHGPWPFVLFGVVALFLTENLIFEHRVHEGGDPHHAHEREEHLRHRTVSFASLFGLSVHAFTAGLGAGASATDPALAEPFLWSLVSHKAVESFSLATVFVLAGFRGSVLAIVLTGFALVTPVGLFLGTGLMPSMGERATGIVAALAAGTFLYVALYDLLPEVFHHPGDRRLKVGLLLAGIALGFAIHLLEA